MIVAFDEFCQHTINLTQFVLNIFFCFSFFKKKLSAKIEHAIKVRIFHLFFFFFCVLCFTTVIFRFTDGIFCWYLYYYSVGN